MRKRGQISSSVLEVSLQQLPEKYAVLLNQFLNDLDVRQNSKATYHRSLLQFFLYMEQQQTALEVCDRAAIIRYKQHLLQQVEAQRLSLLTADNYLNAVRRFFSWIFHSDVLPEIKKNISDKISINADYDGFKKEALTTAQVQLLLENLKEKINTAKSENNKLNALRDYAFVFVMVTTGLRTISITRMNIADLTLLYGTHIAYVQHKGRTDKDDFVVLEAATYKAIFDYLKFRLKIDDFLKLPESTSAEPLFVGHSNRNNGERLTTDRLRQVVKAHLRTIGLNHKVFSAHSLRHTYGTLQLRLTGDIFQVAENMGHKDLKSTKRYTAKERQRQRIDTHTPLTHLFKKDE